MEDGTVLEDGTMLGDGTVLEGNTEPASEAVEAGDVEHTRAQAMAVGTSLARPHGMEQAAVAAESYGSALLYTAMLAGLAGAGQPQPSPSRQESPTARRQRPLHRPLVLLQELPLELQELHVLPLALPLELPQELALAELDGAVGKGSAAQPNEGREDGAIAAGVTGCVVGSLVIRRVLGLVNLQRGLGELADHQGRTRRRHCRHHRHHRHHRCPRRQSRRGPHHLARHPQSLEGTLAL